MRRSSFVTIDARVALAMFAREEIGRYRILLDYWTKAATGQAFDAEHVGSDLLDHVDKQRAAVLSPTYNEPLTRPTVRATRPEH